MKNLHNIHCISICLLSAGAPALLFAPPQNIKRVYQDFDTVLQAYKQSPNLDTARALECAYNQLTSPLVRKSVDNQISSAGITMADVHQTIITAADREADRAEQSAQYAETHKRATEHVAQAAEQALKVAAKRAIQEVESVARAAAAEKVSAEIAATSAKTSAEYCEQTLQKMLTVLNTEFMERETERDAAEATDFATKKALEQFKRACKKTYDAIKEFMTRTSALPDKETFYHETDQEKIAHLQAIFQEFFAQFKKLEEQKEDLKKMQAKLLHRYNSALCSVVTQDELQKNDSLLQEAHARHATIRDFATELEALSLKNDFITAAHQLQELIHATENTLPDESFLGWFWNWKSGKNYDAPELHYFMNQLAQAYEAGTALQQQFHNKETHFVQAGVDTTQLTTAQKAHAALVDQADAILQKQKQGMPTNEEN